MKTTTLMWVGTALIIIVGGWYFSSLNTAQPEVSPYTDLGMNGSQSKTDTNTGEVSVPPEVTIATSAKLGHYLVAANGMTLYMYTKDTPNVSNCSDVCVFNWRPYSGSGAELLVLGAGLTGKLIRIIRTDGTKQLSYNGAPLYFWKNDTKPGDTTGQNVAGVWFVVKP